MEGAHESMADERTNLGLAIVYLLRVHHHQRGLSSPRIGRPVASRPEGVVIGWAHKNNVSVNPASDHSGHKLQSTSCCLVHLVLGLIESHTCLLEGAPGWREKMCERGDARGNQNQGDWKTFLVFWNFSAFRRECDVDWKFLLHFLIWLAACPDSGLLAVHSCFSTHSVKLRFDILSLTRMTGWKINTSPKTTSENERVSKQGSQKSKPSSK